MNSSHSDPQICCLSSYFSDGDSAGTEQPQPNQSGRISKPTKKRKRFKFDVAGDQMDRLLGMQEEMMVEMKEKRVMFVEKQTEHDTTMR